MTGCNRLPRVFARFPKFGVFLVLFTWIGIPAAVPGFLWLDPFVLFTTLFQWSNASWNPLATIPLILLPATWFLPTFWCRHVCPLGGTQDILYAPHALRKKIRDKSGTQPSPAGGNRPPLQRRRRLFLTVMTGIGLGVVFESIRRRRSLSELRSTIHPTIRPPGALDEPLFSTLCARCGACVAACPTKLLKPMKSGETVLGMATPRAVFDPAWCRDDCVACTQVCPSGALGRILPEEKKDCKLGLAVFEFEYCRLYDDRECSICSRECPFEAISFQWSEEEYRQMLVIDADRCTGCGRCLVSCPVGKEERAGDDKPSSSRLPLSIRPIRS